MLAFSLILVTGQSFGVQRDSGAISSNQVDDARKHLARARDMDSTGDPRAEQEYRLAIQAGENPEAIQALAVYLERELRFSESARLLREYIRRTPSEDHTDDLRDITTLIQAAKIRSRVETSATPSLSDILKFVAIADGYGGVERATSYAKRAVQLYPRSADALVALAKLTTTKDEKFSLLNRALALEPNNAKVHSELGGTT